MKIQLHKTDRSAHVALLLKNPQKISPSKLLTYHKLLTFSFEKAVLRRELWRNPALSLSESELQVHNEDEENQEQSEEHIEVVDETADGTEIKKR